MRKEKLIKELQKTREKKQAIIKREQELEHDLREAEKEETAVIMEKYKISAEDLREMLKEAPGAERIYTAGEKEYEVRLAREYGVPINASVQKEMVAVRDKLALNYTFPWEE